MNRPTTFSDACYQALAHLDLAHDVLHDWLPGWQFTPAQTEAIAAADQRIANARQAVRQLLAVQW